MTASENGRDQTLDNEQIDSLITAAGVEGTQEILAAFWRSSDGLIAQLKIEIAAGDFDAASRTAHGVKGSAANVGAVRFAAFIQTLEAACQNTDSDRATAMFVELDEEYANAQNAFADYLKKAAAA